MDRHVGRRNCADVSVAVRARVAPKIVGRRDRLDENYEVKRKMGVDGDLIAGYDFGLVRAELEGAYKWTEHGDIRSGRRR